MAWLQKRGNMWYLYWREGKRRRKKRLSTDKQAAIGYKAEFEKANYLGELSLPNRLKTWNDFKVEYLKYSDTNKSDATLKIDRNALAHFTRIVKPASLVCIVPSDIENYKTSRVNEQVKPVTVNIEFRAIKAAFNKAVQWKYLKENPAKTVKSLTVQRKIRFLTDYEAEQLLDACDDHIRPVILTFLYTGMRLGELLNLTWREVNFKNQEISIRANDKWNTKNNRERVIPLHPNIAKVLKTITVKTGSIFKTMSGNKLDQTTLEEKFRAAVKRAKIEHCRIHDLRHTFASHLAQKGVDLYRISKLLGHTSIKTTEIYAHLVKSDLVNSVALLNF